MRKALTALIAELDAPQQPLCRAFLAQQGYGDLTKLTEIQIQEAINIVAGWPDTAQAAADEADVIEAEIVQEQMNEPEGQMF